MPNFDFSTLNSTDLEEFVCDLLNAQEKSNNTTIIYRTFKEGKDKGIDFLYSTPSNQYFIVGQVKHYFRSGYKALIETLKKDELPKIIKLKPDRYIIATSVDLSVLDIDKIKQVLSPHIKNLSDILGLKDLNRAIDVYPSLLTNHFKLWYSSTIVLQKLLNYNIEGRSLEFVEKEIKKRLRLYVRTNHYYEALKTLTKNRFIVITGEPGVGKTTLAEMLLYDFIRNDYKLTYIYDDIKEAEEILKDDKTKEIFYFDDFLGHNSYEIARAKGSETALIKVLRRISHLENKYFVLTTRTFILNAAIHESEKLRKFNIKAKESTLSLKEYNKDIRFQLLLNHIEESKINDVLKGILRKNNITNFIISHTNFSPRSIEFITSSEEVGSLSVDKFEYFIIHNFNSPDEIWRHAYEQQINDIDRFLLNTMLSFGDSVDIEILESAFIGRLNYEVKYNNLQRPMNAFKSAFNRLEGGFIIREFEHDSRYLKFINQSLVDFLIQHIKNNKDEVIRIAESATCLEQLTTRLFVLFESNSSIKLPYKLQNKLINEYNEFIREDRKDSDLLVLSFLIYKYAFSEDNELKIINFLYQVSEWSIIQKDTYLSYQLKLFIEIINEKQILNSIESLRIPIFSYLILSENDIDSAFKLLILMENKFHISPKTLFLTELNDEFSEHFSELLNEKIEDEIEFLSYNTYDEWLVEEKHRELIAVKEQLSLLGLNIVSDFSEFLNYDWHQIGIENFFRDQMEKED